MFRFSLKNILTVLVATTVLIVGLLGLVSCGHNNVDPNKDTPLSGVDIYEAKKVLNQTPTGAQVAKDLETLQSSKKITGIIITKHPTKSVHQGHLKDNGDGSYTILIPPQLSREQTAQVLAHEISHVKDKIDEAAFMKQNPEIEQRVKRMASIVKQNQIGQVTSSEDKGDLNFYLATRMYSEVKAYQLNLQLEKEGIPFSNDALHQKGVIPYVTDMYTPEGVSATDAVSTLLSNVEQYSSIVDFEESLLPSKTNSNR